MSDQSVWDKVLAEISSPWDWAAAGLGAVVGLGVTALSGGADLGTSAGFGAIAGVTARKAIVASSQRPLLKRCAQRFLELLEQKGSSEPSINRLREDLTNELELFNLKVTEVPQFREQLNEMINRYRTLWLGSELAPPSELPPSIEDATVLE